MGDGLLTRLWSFLNRRPIFAKLGAPSAFALVRRVLRHDDVATPSAEEPPSFTSPHHDLEVISLHTVRASDGFRHFCAPLRSQRSSACAHEDTIPVNRFDFSRESYGVTLVIFPSSILGLPQPSESHQARQLTVREGTVLRQKRDYAVLGGDFGVDGSTFFCPAHGCWHFSCTGKSNASIPEVPGAMGTPHTQQFLGFLSGSCRQAPRPTPPLNHLCPINSYALRTLPNRRHNVRVHAIPGVPSIILAFSFP
jgi:hypothetical protein